MCNLSQRVEEKGIQKGRQEGLVEGILFALQNAIKNKGIPVDEALAMIGLPEADWPKYRQLLAEQ